MARLTTTAVRPRRGTALPRSVVVVGACMLLAALSLLVTSAPGADAHAWLLWGRQVADASLQTTGPFSWKPLPVLITTPLSLFGGAAPELWLVIVRTASLLSLVLAYRLAARRGGWVAGLAAATLLLLVSEDSILVARGWLRYGGLGLSDPLAVMLVLAAVQRHLDGRPRQALLLGMLAALDRPEIWAFLCLYGLFCAVREPHTRPLVALVVVAVPALWVIPDWIASGNLFHGGEVARQSGETAHFLRVNEHPTRIVAGRGLGLVIPTAYLMAAVAFVWGWRERDGFVLWLGGAAAAWGITVLLLATRGFASTRFFLPGMALLCVLAGIGAARLAAAARPAARVGAAVVAVATVPFAVIAAAYLPDQLEGLRSRSAEHDELLALVEHAGGPGPIKACGRPTSPASFASVLAWELDLPLSGVRFSRYHPRQFSALFVRNGHALPPLRAGERRFLLSASSGDWRLFTRCRRGGPLAGLRRSGD